MDVRLVEQGYRENRSARGIDYRRSRDADRVDVAAGEAGIRNRRPEVGFPQDATVADVDRIDAVVLGGDQNGAAHHQWLRIDGTVEGRRGPGTDQLRGGRSAGVVAGVPEVVVVVEPVGVSAQRRA